MTDSTHEIDPSKMSAAERLALGGAVAPILRRKAGSGRRITTVDHEGKPVRVVDDVALAKSLLARSEIEFSVVDGKRPAFVDCKVCGRPVKVPKTGAMPTVCRPGAHKCGCGVLLMGAGCRFGKSCMSCNMRRRMAALTPEQRSDMARKVNATLTPEQRSERSRKASASLTPEQWSEMGKRGGKARMAGLTPEQRSENGHRLRDTTAPDVRRERASKAGKASKAARDAARLTTAADSATP